MSDSPPLTPAQRRFLRALELDCDPTGPPVRVLGKLPLSRMARWLQHPAFRARIDKLLEMVAKKRRMTLQMASGRAADRLDGAFDEGMKLDSEQRRTCLELVKLVEGRRGAGTGSSLGAATGDSIAQPRQTRTAKSAESGASEEISSPPDLAHPDLPAREVQELKERLESRRG